MFGLLRALTLDDGLARFDQWKRQHNVADAVEYGAAACCLCAADALKSHSVEERHKHMRQ